MATKVRKAKGKPALEPWEPEPTWEIAKLFPPQGQWSEEEYLELDTNHLVEFSDGFLEFLPIPTIFHQLILQFIFENLKSFVASQKLGTVVTAGYKVRLRSGKFREPDILFIKAAHQSHIGTQYCRRADLVIEVVSDKKRAHDLRKKRLEYARAGIPEYWIVDPQKESITVLVKKTKERTYTEHGRFPKGTRAVSKLLPGFSVEVTEALSQRP